MNQLSLDTPVEFLKSIGPERAKLIRNVLDIATVEDFLNFYPIRYLDKSQVYDIKNLSDTLPEVQLKGRIIDLKELGEGRSKRLAAKFQDETGIIDLVWFKYSKWLKEQLPVNKTVYIFGKVTLFNSQFSMAHPEIEVEELKEKPTGLLPIYPGSEKLSKRGLNQKFFQNVLRSICTQIPALLTENIPDAVRQKLKLMPRAEAYLNIHFPGDLRKYEQANRRIKFEEAFFFQLSYALKKQHHQANAIGNPFTLVGDYFTTFYRDHLPFPLTNAQKRVIREIRTDMRRPVQMNRLLQGDVGSGKTIVALLAMLIAMDNGFQSVMMAPTEILAQQHYNSLKELTEIAGIQIRLLTGSTKKSERKSIHDSLLSGDLSILVGTHAVLEDTVGFSSLGMVVIDEQHRFGVAQRAKLWSKNTRPPHVLVMTATPIPRTLAMTLYGDLDVSVIDELPPGRKPIQTIHQFDNRRASLYAGIRKQINEGRQIYIVYPLIKESEKIDIKNLEEGYGHICAEFPECQVSKVHGQMKPAEKDAEMQRFVNGETQIMVATTVIEVGVNVPNASVMVIENAERFGLSQLHQLRGRVGRGADQSYCILVTSYKLSEETRKRLEIMVQTNDGFEIAEADLKLRGPGDLEGTQQSGVAFDLKIADIARDGQLLQHVREIATEIIEKDPTCVLPENEILWRQLQSLRKTHVNWSAIS